eukprot:7052354-Ditylum_brightwellii.AAC.1
MESISLLQVPITWPDVDTDVSKVTHLGNPKEADHWKTVKIPKEIATYLKLQNSMSFTIPPLLVEFDWAGNSINLELVLEDEYRNSALEFLQYEKVDIYEWKDKIRTWKEQITTPSS